MRRIYFLILVILMAVLRVDAQESISNEYFNIQFGPRGITSLKHSHDVYDTEYIMEGKVIGDVLVRYRIGEKWNEKWKKIWSPRIPFSDREKIRSENFSPSISE